MVTVEIPVRSWQDFRSALFDTLYPAGQFEADHYLFRGQREHSWPLKASFDRTFTSIAPGQRRKKFEAMLNFFEEACEAQGIPTAFSTDVQALAQHYGLPTRILDWSRSPYVAAFFAFAHHVLECGLPDLKEARSRLLELPENVSHDELLAFFEKGQNSAVAVWALDSQNPLWSDDFGANVKNATSMVGNVRLRNQGGSFTRLDGQEADLEAWAKSLEPDPGTVLWKFVLPACEALAALSDLRAMGIDFSRVYPDLQGAAFDAKLRGLCGLF